MTTASIAPAPGMQDEMQGGGDEGGKGGVRTTADRGNNDRGKITPSLDEECEDGCEGNSSQDVTSVSPASPDYHRHTQQGNIHESQEEKKQAHGDEDHFIRSRKSPKNGVKGQVADKHHHARTKARRSNDPEDAVDDDGDDEEEDGNGCDVDSDGDQVLPLKTGDKQEYYYYDEGEEEDDDDDDDGYNDDPYVYSDDSESLSDAYFHPQQERRQKNYFLYPHHPQQHETHKLSHNIVTPPEEVKTTAPNHRSYGNTSPPPSSREQHSLFMPHNQESARQERQNQHMGAVAPSYGSMSADRSRSPPPAFPKGIMPWSKPPQVSPLNTQLPRGTILEDCPIEEDDVVVWRTTAPSRKLHESHPFYNDSQFWQQQHHQQQHQGKLPPHHQHKHQQQSSRTKKYHRKRPKRSKRRQHHHQQSRDNNDFEPQRQQHQYAREHAVTQVRGKQQDLQSCNDSCFGILFVLQFLFVLVCAIRYGCTLMRPTPLVNPTTMSITIASNGSKTFSSLGPSAVYQPDEVVYAPNPPHLTSISSLKTTITGGAETTTTTTTTTKTVMDKDDSTTTTTLGKERNGDKTTTTRISDSSLNDDMIIDMGYEASKKGDSQAPITTATTAKASSTTPTTIEEVTTVNGVADFSIDYQNVIKLLCVSGVYACVISYLTFGFMLIVARSLIQIILVFSVILALAWGICGTIFSDPSGFIALMGFSAVILSMWYALYSWNRIPFASTNLHTAMCAMRCTGDIILLGAAALLLSFLWSLVWAIALIGVVNTGNSNDCIETDDCETHIKTNHWNVPTYAVFCFSFYWTNMVIKNITRVTVASTIGTWWFTPHEIHPCCSHSVGRPLVRSLTTSFGSICLGSLVVSPAQWITVLSGCCFWLSRGEADDQHEPFYSSPRSNGGNGGFRSPEGKLATTPTTETSPLTTSSTPSESNFEDANDAEATGDHYRHPRILTQTTRFLRCCNKWSFTYVGMYNYPFLKGGEKAIQLFETREWMDVVQDNLIHNILLMASVVIGGSAGTFAVLVEEVDGYTFTTLNEPIITSCLLGSVLGFVLSNMLLSGVVGSAVNTILVCFAAGPFEFDKNHPRLSREMREVWSQQVWEPSESVV